MYYNSSHITRHRLLSSIIFGTTKNPSADSGALATARSTDRDGRAMSGRNTLTCPSTVAVGSTPVVSYCFNVSTCVRIWLNCFANAAFSISVNSSRASFATFSTSCCVISIASPCSPQEIQHDRRESGDRERRVLEQHRVDRLRFIERIHGNTRNVPFSRNTLESEYHGTHRNSREIPARIQTESRDDQTSGPSQRVGGSSHGTPCACHAAG